MFIYQQFFALSLVYLAGCGDDAPPAVNSAPEFGEDNYAFEVAENAATGDAVGTVSATDEENDELTYTVVGSRTTFDIGAGTGAVIVADSVALDFETTTSYSIRAQVSDGTNMDTADLTVTITNVNDNAPAFANDSYEFKIAADAAGGSEVGEVSATDADAMLTYSISGEGSAHFAVTDGKDVASGEEATVAVAANADLPLLFSPVKIKATVSDGANTNDAEVEIVVTPTEVNMAPVFANTPYNFSVASDAADGDTDLVVGNFDGTLSIWYRYADTNTWETTSDAI